MKKHFEQNKKIAILSFAILSFLTLCACLVACNKQSAQADSEPPYYEISLSLDTATDTLVCHQDVIYRTPKDVALDKIVFHLYANAFGTIDILCAQIDTINTVFEIYGESDTLLSMPCNVQGDNILVVSFDYQVSLATASSRLCKTTNGNYNLSHFYPVLAVYDNGWQEGYFSSIGDPFYCEVSSFLVDATYPSAYTLASSGEVIFETSEELSRTVVQAQNVRDFGLSIGKYTLQTDSVELASKQVEISYFYTADNNATLALNRAKQSLATFSSAFCEYPYNTLTLVQNNLDAGGMEYGGYVLVAPCNDTTLYLDVITHEIAHQWWYNLVGNDQTMDAWLDEGLTEFCTAYFYHLNGDSRTHLAYINANENAYRTLDKLRYTVGFNGTMSRPLTSYLTEGEYVAVSYLKGSLLFETLRNVAGDEKFCACLKGYCQANYMSIASKQALLDAFLQNGIYAQGIVDSFVNDTLVFCS